MTISINESDTDEQRAAMLQVTRAYREEHGAPEPPCPTDSGGRSHGLSLPRR